MSGIHASGSQEWGNATENGPRRQAYGRNVTDLHGNAVNESRKFSREGLENPAGYSGCACDRACGVRGQNAEKSSRDARILLKPFSRAILLEEVRELVTAAASKRRDGWNGNVRPATNFLSLSGKESPQ